MKRDLRGKVIVITGASSGIGAATALACAAAGMRLTLAARRESKLREVAQAAEAAGRQGAGAEGGARGGTIVVSCDVDDQAAVDRLFKRSWNAHGRLDAVFANAGYGLVASVLETTDAQARAIFETNFFGTIRTIKEAIPQLRRTAEEDEHALGHVLICSSAASEIAPPCYGVYAATKAAQDSIAGAMRAELADEGLHVTSVHPVGTRTDLFRTAHARSQSGQHSAPQLESEAGAGEEVSMPLNTPATFTQTPEDVARAVVRGLRRPRPEVWPMVSARFALAGATALPRLTAAVVRRMARRSS